jgi:hypothetical protein
VFTVKPHRFVAVQAVLRVAGVALKLNATPETSSDGFLSPAWFFFF